MALIMYDILVTDANASVVVFQVVEQRILTNLAAELLLLLVSDIVRCQELQS